MKNIEATKEHMVIIKHLRKTRELGKHILKVNNEYGSALISHGFEIRSEIDPGIVMYSKVDFIPLIRMYKTGKDKIVDDENLLNEDIENVTD